MRLVVHMGAVKTAAGFLQRCLHVNEDLLRAKGIYLPRSGRLDPTYEMVTHHNLGWQLLGDVSYREASGGWSDLADELATVEADIVLLSSETFARLASDPLRRPDLAERLSALSDDVTLVYVVRDPLERINSLYEQTVTAFGLPSAFDDYLSHSVGSGYYNLDESYRFWFDSDQFSFVATRFDEMVADGPLPALLAALGVSVAPDELKTPEHVAGPRPGPTAIEAMRVLNAHLRVVDAGFTRRSVPTHQLAQLAERRAAKLGWSDERYWGWRRKQAEWAVGKLEAGNQAFARTVWGTDWPLPYATTRPQRITNLLTAERKTQQDLLTYLSFLTARYVAFVKQQSASVRKPLGRPTPGGSGEEAEAAAQSAQASVTSTAVVDPSTVISDEAERSAGLPIRRVTLHAEA